MKKESKGNPEFKRWLALYFIEKGNWKPTAKAIEEFGTDATPKQTMEFAEDYSSREREERLEYRVGFTAKEKRKIAHMKIAGMIEEGKAKELYDNGYITYSADWKDKTTSVAVIRNVVRIIGKDPRDLKRKDFQSNRLGRLLTYHYNDSPYKAVKEAFPELDIKPWEMTATPHGYFDDKENRIVAVKWLVIEKLKKDPRDLRKEDFCSNRLSGLFQLYYNSSPYEAAKEAFPEMDIKPWEMAKTPMGFYEEKENRIAAVKWFVIEKLKKDPRDLRKEDFYSNRLGGLLTYYYNDSPYEAVKEVFPELKIQPWEMQKTPGGFYEEKENRIAAVKRLVKKINKDLRDLMQKDFHNNGLGGLLCRYYNNSPYEALKEAGLVSEADGHYMRRYGTARFQTTPSSKEARESARKLARNAEKPGPKKKPAKKLLTSK